MANCGPIQFLDGGILNQPTINDPTIYGGKIVNTELSNVSLVDNIRADDAVIRRLADLLIPLLDGQITIDAGEVAGVFKSCHGLPLVPDTQIPTCSEMEEAIRLAVCEGCGGGEGSGDTITNFTWENNYTILRISVKYEDNTTKNWDVDFSALNPLVLSVETPASTMQSELPTTVYGERTALLGKGIWLETTIGGQKLIIPAYVPGP